MSACPPIGGYMMGMTRAEQIEAWIRSHPERVIAPPQAAPNAAPEETRDRHQVGSTFGTYRRNKHAGSADR